MKHLAVILLFPGLFATSIYARQSAEIDSLLTCLDSAIGKRAYYEQKKETKIDSLKHALNTFNRPEDIYATNNRIISEYRSFIYDSAMVYTNRNIKFAKDNNNRIWTTEMKISLANTYLTGGFYKEAVDTIRSIPRKTLNGDLLKRYYQCCEQTCHHMSMYADDNYFSPEYDRMSLEYLDSLIAMTDKNNSDYIRYLARSYAARGKTEEARSMLTELLNQVEFGSHSHAMLTAKLSGLYPADDPLRKKYLILSATSDVISAVRENQSLRNLATLLFNEGNIDKAYKYCNISMEDANNFNARLRRIEVARILPIIDRAYQRELYAQHHKLQKYFVATGLLCAISVGFLIMLLIQNRIIRRSRMTVVHVNEQLRHLNQSLLEANRIKEGYIGHFLNKCSFYINKLEKYRTMVYSKLVGGKIEELKNMTKSADIVDHEIKEFYRSFDKAFLELYPDFVNKFNEMLRPDEHISPAGDELLSTELRIFALIKLGISDSSQIATFLRYSANTVYTYRTKVKNKAINRADFDADLMNIGRIES